MWLCPWLVLYLQRRQAKDLIVSAVVLFAVHQSRRSLIVEMRCLFHNHLFSTSNAAFELSHRNEDVAMRFGRSPERREVPLR
jgi:hypothetical protein